jgi:hypothetical protein
MLFGIKVSKPGYDVKTCNDKDLIFSSQWNVFKIKARGSFTVTVPPRTIQEVEVRHNLGYSPAFLAFFDNASPGRFYPMREVSSTPSSLFFRLVNISNASQTFQIVYFLLAEKNA